MYLEKAIIRAGGVDVKGMVVFLRRVDMSAKEFEGKVVLVTGGSRGIGRAICHRLASEGAKIAINYQGDQGAAEATLADVEDIGSEGIVVQANVGKSDEVTRLVRDTESKLGPIDFLVTNAGIAEMEPPDEMHFEAFKRMMEVNVDGTYLPLMEVGQGMRSRGFGRVVCIASIAGLRPRASQAAYGVSKAAVIALARNVAEGWAPAVRINSVAPGLIETDMIQVMSEKQRNAIAEATPMKRLGQPEEIAELTAFLLSERASFITGQCYVASGGRVTLP